MLCSNRHRLPWWADPGPPANNADADNTTTGPLADHSTPRGRNSFLVVYFAKAEYGRFKKIVLDRRRGVGYGAGVNAVVKPDAALRKGRLRIIVDPNPLPLSVSSEMIEVGAAILGEYGGFGPYTARHLAEDVYRAMADLRAELPTPTG
jgi:hypothetical protein